MLSEGIWMLELVVGFGKSRQPGSDFIYPRPRATNTDRDEQTRKGETVTAGKARFRAGADGPMLPSLEGCAST